MNTSQLTAYIHYFENITASNVGDLGALVTDTVHFRDPFNDGHGRDFFIAAMRKMFHDCNNPKFTITDYAIGQHAAYLRWHFTATLKNGTPWPLYGMSEIHFSDDGRITAHLDHWDSGFQVYARTPILGAIIRWIRGLLGVKS